MRVELYGCKGTELNDHEDVFEKYLTYLYANKLEYIRSIEWSLRAECLFLRARAFDKQLQKFCEHEQASTHLIFASFALGKLFASRKR